MELALLLVLLVVVELVLTVFMVARHRDYLRRVKRLENNVSKLAAAVRDWDGNMDVASGAAPDTQDFASLLEGVTPEDIKQAQTILGAFGAKGE